MDQELSDSSFLEALSIEDDLGSVIRVHLHIEFHINEMLNLLIPYPDDLKQLKLDYDGNVKLLCALGFHPKLKPMLSTIGKMRNKFAHNPFYTLSRSEINNLYKSLDEFDKKMVQETHEILRNKETWKGYVRPYSELSPKEQFVLISIIIRNVLKEGINEIKEKNE